jgi:hypothetical protein
MPVKVQNDEVTRIVGMKQVTQQAMPEISEAGSIKKLIGVTENIITK